MVLFCKMKNARNNPTKISENKLPGVKSQSTRNKEEGTTSQRVLFNVQLDPNTLKRCNWKYRWNQKSKHKYKYLISKQIRFWAFVEMSFWMIWLKNCPGTRQMFDSKLPYNYDILEITLFSTYNSIAYLEKAGNLHSLQIQLKRAA